MAATEAMVVSRYSALNILNVNYTWNKSRKPSVKIQKKTKRTSYLYYEMTCVKNAYKTLILMVFY